MKHLSIVTVVINKHIKFLDLFIELIKRNGGYSDFTIHIIINDDSEYNTTESQVLVHHGEYFDRSSFKFGAGSYHHGYALNNFINKLNPVGHLLVIDPDMFVVYKNWIREVINYMTKANIALFGVPWHPQWYTKYRYFPCVHLLFIDLEITSEIGDINFIPFIPQEKNTGFWSSNHLVNLVKNKTIFYWLLSRLNINASKDTGHWIHQRFKSFKDLYYTLLPVVSFEHHFRKPSFLKKNFFGLIENYVPSRFSFFPKSDTYINIDAIQFKDGIKKNLSFAEFFYWRGEPFCFHLRGESTLLRQSTGVEKVLEIYGLFARCVMTH